MFHHGTKRFRQIDAFKAPFEGAGADFRQIIVNDMDLEKMPRRYIPKYRRRLGMVFQDFRLLKDKTVYENVAFAQRVIGVSPREIKKNVPEMLRLVGLSSKYKAYPNQLSGASSSVLRLPVR